MQQETGGLTKKREQIYSAPSGFVFGIQRHGPGLRSETRATTFNPKFSEVAGLLIGEDQQIGLHQTFCKPVDSQGKLGADGADAYADEFGGLSVGVFLKNDAADQFTIEGRETVEAPFHIENEDQCVFEGSNATAGDPAAAHRLAEEIWGTAYLQRGVEIATKQFFGVFSVECVGDSGFRRDFDWGLGWCVSFGQLLLDVVNGGREQLRLEGR